MKILETYRNTRYDKDGPGLVLITDAMPVWNQVQWRALMITEGVSPEPRPWTPSYLLAFGFDSISGTRYPLEQSRWFADAPTAQYIADKFGTGVVRETDMLAPGSYSVDQKMLEFQLADGRWINAGVIAAYYERNPIDTAPGVAEKSINAVLYGGTGDGK